MDDATRGDSVPFDAMKVMLAFQSPAAPSPGRLTAHGALGCSPPPPRVPRRHACPLP